MPAPGVATQPMEPRPAILLANSFTARRRGSHRTYRQLGIRARVPARGSSRGNFRPVRHRHQLIRDAPSFFTAIQEQLGLKLDATKGPVEVWVIDSIEAADA